MHRVLIAILKALPGVPLALFIAAASVGPEEAAHNLKKWMPPGWADALLSPVAIAIAVGILIVYVVVLASPLISRQFGTSTIPILEAARIAFEVAEHSDVEEFVSSIYQSADDKLSYFVNGFLVHNDIRVYGKKSPSTVLRLIPRIVLAQLHHNAGENRLVADFAGSTGVYTDVSINRRDFRRYLRWLRRLRGSFENA